MSSLKGIENGRAQFAYEQVQEAIGKFESKTQKEYKAYCRKIPMMIKTNGIGNTLAFMKSKGNKAYDLLYEQIHNWFKNHRTYILNPHNDLVHDVIKQESQTYRAVTLEVLSLFNWLKRFADGLIEGEE